MLRPTETGARAHRHRAVRLRAGLIRDDWAGSAVAS